MYLSIYLSISKKSISKKVPAKPTAKYIKVPSIFIIKIYMWHTYRSKFNKSSRQFETVFYSDLEQQHNQTKPNKKKGMLKIIT